MPRLNLPLLRNPPLNAHYEGAYNEKMFQWRALTALDKAANIHALLGDHAQYIRSTLDVGCGTGAVSLEVARLNIGDKHVGIDMADPLAHAHPGVLEAGIELQHQTSHALPFADSSFDLVFASHVLEHVADEREFLAELKRVARRWIYIEVPCELHLRTSMRALQTTLDIGHINAYTPESLALTLATSAHYIEEMQAFDHSLAVHAYSSNKAKAYLKAALRRSLLWASPQLATRLFTYHVGALCDASKGAEVPT